MKEFLSKQDIAFIERDIVNDHSAMQELETLGYMTTPVTVIDGTVVVGFDRRKLQQLLNS